MKVESTRFGTLEVDEQEVITFASGMIGFPKDKRYIVVPHSEVIAFLQSCDTPELAFPLVSAHGLAHDYPDVDLVPIANKVGLGTNTEDWAVMAVLAAPKGQPATVNLLAPVIVNVATRVGAQLFLEGSSYTTRELFVMRTRTDESGEENQTLEKAAAG